MLKSSIESPLVLLTPEEASEVLRVSRETIYRHLRSGLIRSQKVGRVWRIPYSEIRRVAGEIQDEPK